jgi:3-hydroxyacyl-[acyl-carrier protein] dehydratase/trans-2-decenoyl-[acyl-carrier protein] isomerase
LTYAEFRERRRFDRDELLRFAEGLLLVDAPSGFHSRLPTPPMLMIDRIVELERTSRTRGRLVAERDVHPDDWYFRCHFVGDPVQPGCLGVDGIWQLIGFYCAWNGAVGFGRALGSGEIEFSGQILQHNRLVRYEIDVIRYSELAASGVTMAIADARLMVDGELIYTVQRAKVGIFRSLERSLGTPRQ